MMDQISSPMMSGLVDLIEPFKKSVKQILCETGVVTTRRFLERFVVHHFPQRAVWKLLKDVPKSALLQINQLDANLHFTPFVLAGTTIRVAPTSCVRDITKSKNEGEDVDIVVYKGEQVKVLGKRVCGVTVRCGASLVFASIGAGISATLLRPKTGQSLGCLLGDMVGPIIVSFCFANVPYLEL
ncbi:hypothetical protein Tco_1044323 [Tanacetum coccineum]|uniref:Uncharacterized protein n=1 Tax=Tanacetum coccineum TaxID=301880 RepID=A0ABQ5GQ02_9ASTR